jgi:serine protease Do
VSKSFWVALLGGALGSALLLACYLFYVSKLDSNPAYTSFETHQNALLPASVRASAQGSGLNFVVAAALSRPTVVNITTTYGKGKNYLNRSERSPLEDFFGPSERYHNFNEDSPREASGSGVIISDDGFIVTNNHVINEASNITVLLNDKRRYKAELVGTDPTTDLALLRIKATGLPFAQFGNSDSLMIGEWVLAVGNPFELTSTVTAGIVSAKARNINILSTTGGQGRDNMAIESFIQTDAAVNPGNSGGALVNLRGQLIGINTAIASTTGTYTGYAFAVPVTLVKKVMDDLLRYGQVQRALLGVSIRDVDADLAEAKSIPDFRGVYVAGVLDLGAAGKAGIREGDIILNINGTEVNSVSSLQEYVARFRPGDKVKVDFERGKDKKATTVTLRNAAGTEKVEKASPKKENELTLNKVGAKLRTASAETRALLGITGGVEVVETLEGSPFSDAGIEVGFVITQVDKRPIAMVEDLERALSESKGGVLLEGMYPDGRRVYYGLGL